MELFVVAKITNASKSLFRLFVPSFHGGNFEMDITNFYSTYYQSFNSDYFIEKYNKKNKRGNC